MTIRSTIILTTIFMVSSATFYKAGASNEAEQPTSLSTFLSLHEQYCERDIESREALIDILEKDQRFKLATNFIGVFEVEVAGVSYAVSPEIDGCTTDVMVKNEETEAILFSYEEIDKALIKKGYKVLFNEKMGKDIGSDKKEVTVIEKVFISPKGEITKLHYPSDRPDKYYVALFANKFTDSL